VKENKARVQMLEENLFYFLVFLMTAPVKNPYFEIERDLEGNSSDKRHSKGSRSFYVSALSRITTGAFEFGWIFAACSATAVIKPDDPLDAFPLAVK
jgi:hypothetical protein